MSPFSGHTNLKRATPLILLAQSAFALSAVGSSAKRQPRRLRLVQSAVIRSGLRDWAQLKIEGKSAGRLDARDPVTGERRWTYEMSVPLLGSVLPLVAAWCSTRSARHGWGVRCRYGKVLPGAGVRDPTEGANNTSLRVTAAISKRLELVHTTCVSLCHPPRFSQLPRLRAHDVCQDTCPLHKSPSPHRNERPIVA